MGGNKQKLFLFCALMFVVLAVGLFGLRFVAQHPTREQAVAATAVNPSTPATGRQFGGSRQPFTADELSWRRYHTERVSVPDSGMAATAANQSGLDTNGVFTLSFRAISFDRITHNASANQMIAHEVVEQIQQSALFDQETAVVGKLGDEESPGTFTFTVAAKLRKPLKL
jgi:hypothetical protein